MSEEEFAKGVLEAGHLAAVHAEPNGGCNHIISWTMYLVYDNRGNQLKKMGEKEHLCAYCPKCGDKL